MTTKEHAAAIRAALKVKGWTSRDVSVRADSYSLGSSIDVRIKNPAVSLADVKAIAKGHESVRYCEFSGEILSGGNRFVSVSYSREAVALIETQYAAVLSEAAWKLDADQSSNSLHPIGDTGFLLGRGHNGGYSLWKDSHITTAYEAKHLAVSLHTGFSGRAGAGKRTI